MNIQPGSAIALSNATNLVEYCARCESEIKGEVFIRDAEKDAPYTPSPYCSKQCCDLTDEDVYEVASTPRD